MKAIDKVFITAVCLAGLIALVTPIILLWILVSTIF